MALFGAQKKSEKKSPDSATFFIPADTSHVILRPRITEKATLEGMKNVYVFDVAIRATKSEIRKAFAQQFKVTPRMVRVVKIPAKQRRNMKTGTRGVTAAAKKAYVYLKEGESITTS